MVSFSDIDYFNIRVKILEKLREKDYFSGHIRGITDDGVKYKLVCYVLNFKDRARIVPVWWEMFTYNDYGDSILNDFNFNDINWL